jgi:hypothetical protein
MNNKILTKPKSLEFVINSHSSLIENQSIHPAFMVADNIYTQEKNHFFDQILSNQKNEKSSTKNKIISATPAPIRYYKDSKLKSNDKIDIFLNPSDLYLSKKPIAFNKNFRTAQKYKNSSLAAQTESKVHKKTKSFEINYKNIRLPKVSPVSLIPLNKLKSLSPEPGLANPSPTKEIQCEALSMISKCCENFKSLPTPSIKHEKAIVEKYSKKMEWITDVLQSYCDYDSSIIKELYKYSSDSRDNLESERANIVHLMKIGVFDPNKNIVRLRARLKKRKVV